MLLLLVGFNFDTRQTTAAAKRSDWDRNTGLNFSLNWKP
jgi:hypothetical protein